MNIYLCAKYIQDLEAETVKCNNMVDATFPKTNCVFVNTTISLFLLGKKTDSFSSFGDSIIKCKNYHVSIHM